MNCFRKIVDLPPESEASIKLGSAAVRVEWMSNATFLGRCSKLSVRLSVAL